MSVELPRPVRRVGQLFKALGWQRRCPVRLTQQLERARPVVAFERLQTSSKPTFGAAQCGHRGNDGLVLVGTQMVRPRKVSSRFALRYLRPTTRMPTRTN